MIRGSGKITKNQPSYNSICACPVEVTKGGIFETFFWSIIIIIEPIAGRKEMMTLWKK